ncbi:hypothetical protein ANTQUA_LOCUS9584 [Anthophora quadrimaculata]
MSEWFNILQIIFSTLFTWALNSAVGVEHHLFVPRFVKLKRGIVDAVHHVPQGYKLHGSKSLSYKDGKIIPQESLIEGSSSSILKDFKPSVPYTSFSDAQSSEQLSPHSDNLYTMSAGYKIANDNIAKPLMQSGLQLPMYKTSYPLSKASVSQIYAPTLQNKKVSLPIFQVQKAQEYPGYLSTFQSQPLVLNSGNHQFNYATRTPKVNNVQLSAPFLSPLSSFQGEVVPISTATNNPQFPRYKGAAVELYPTVGGFSTVAYQPLQAQPQLHFAHGDVQRVQPVENTRYSTPLQEIRSDVEIINRKKPTRPPPKKDDDDDAEDDGDDEGYRPREKQYRGNSENGDYYETKTGRFFKTPTAEGDFKPSTSFPFKQYDEKFGKYTKQNQDEGSDEKPFTKYNYFSSSDDSDDEQVPPAKYHAEDTSSKPFYSGQEDDEEDEHDYEKQSTDKSSDNTQGLKYFDKDFDEEFEAPYRRELSKERYAKEVPEVEYGSRSSQRNQDNYESEEPSSEGSRMNVKYRRTSQNFKDNEGHNSDLLISTIPRAVYKESFGYKVPQGK